MSSGSSPFRVIPFARNMGLRYRRNSGPTNSWRLLNLHFAGFDFAGFDGLPQRVRLTGQKRISISA